MSYEVNNNIFDIPNGRAMRIEANSYPYVRISYNITTASAAPSPAPHPSLPWYKRTPNMESLLAWELMTILRSGFERSHLLAQIERLDIAREVGQGFLAILSGKGACSFGEPRYFYNPTLYAAPYKKGMVVQSRYPKSRLFISNTLFQSLQLIDGFLPRELYLAALKNQFGDEQRAAQVCSALAQQGLLLSSDSPQKSNSDPGPQRWSFELSVDGELLDAKAWEDRLDFMVESFKPYFFQSRGYFKSPPIRLCGDFKTVLERATPRYFWDLYFKFQSYAEEIPVDLTLSVPISQKGREEFRLESPLLFRWNYTADLRGDSDRMVEGLSDFVSGAEFSGDLMTILTDRELPARLAFISERVRLKAYYSNCFPLTDPLNLSASLGDVVQQSLRPYLCEEGCNAALSLYINGHGDVYTCQLEGAPCLGNIGLGSRVIKQRRRELRTTSSAACQFGKNPGEAPEREKVEQLPQGLEAAASENLSPLNFSCP